MCTFSKNLFSWMILKIKIKLLLLARLIIVFGGLGWLGRKFRFWCKLIFNMGGKLRMCIELVRNILDSLVGFWRRSWNSRKIVNNSKMNKLAFKVQNSKINTCLKSAINNNFSQSQAAWTPPKRTLHKTRTF